jgi:hypothetical protein
MVTVERSRHEPMTGARPGRARQLGLTRDRWLESLLTLGLVLLSALLQLYNPLALDPFIDDVGWIYWTVTLFNSPDAARFCGSLYPCPDLSIGWLGLDLRPLSRYWLPAALEGRPPLFFWLTVATQDLAENAFVARRLASSLPTIGSVALLYLLGRLLVSRSVGAVAALLWTVSPFAVLIGRHGLDDTLLAFCTLLAAIGSLLLVRRPRRSTAVGCGLAIGLAIMSKTTGVLTLAFPLAAAVVYARPRQYRTLVGPGLLALLTVVVTASTMVPWLGRMHEITASNWTNVSPADDPAAGSAPAASTIVPLLAALIRPDDLRTNARAWIEYARSYFGLPVIGLIVVGLLTGLFEHRRAVLYTLLLWLILTLPLLDFARLLYSRYTFSAAPFCYLLAAIGLVGLVDLVAWLVGKARGGALRAARPAARPVARPVGTSAAGRAMAAAVLAGLALLPGIPFAVLLVTEPDEAPLPALDRYQYVEQWFALYGLRDVAERVRAEAARQPVTVLVPRREYAPRSLLPHEALRMYLRGESSVRFVEDSALSDPRSFCQLRRWERSRSPVFLLVNGTRESGPAELRGEAALATKRTEVALARDLPGARLDLRIPRPTAPHWLSLYRIDRADAAAAGRATGGPCPMPAESYLSGWGSARTEPEMTVPIRDMATGASYREGPLPGGWYRPIVWARSAPDDLTLTMRVNGVELEAVPLAAGRGWTWLEPAREVQVQPGGSAELEISVASARPPHAAGASVPRPHQPEALAVGYVGFWRAR